MDIKKASEITTPSAIRLIYGDPGKGKTSTIGFMPGRTLVIDIDGTSSVLKGKDNIDIVDMHDPIIIENGYRVGLPKLLQEIKTNHLDNYDNIVLDNISELETAMLTEYGKNGNNNGVPGIQNYQQLQFWELDLIRYLKTFGKNILITAWEVSDEWQTEAGQIFNRSYPQIRKPILTNVMGLCLQVARLSVSPKTGNRGFTLTPSDAVFAKNQIDDREFCLQEDLFKIGDVDAKS
ncbi:AAA family ATPase [Listeria booriae]|uniref:AAA family ATPase n=1 Tax=Listeria booriae TaxID=1552123 RepID=UPI00162900BB|nr:AAA family ATPase [Listeria booriae]MBC2048230.1 AAA family ATPase [Listeria booriae]MBC2263718.1 AAA family ATPase [Listeria booriae]